MAPGQPLVEGQAGLHGLDAISTSGPPAKGLVLGQGQQVLQFQGSGAQAILLGGGVRPVRHCPHHGPVGQLHFGQALVQGLGRLAKGLLQVHGVA